MTKVLDKLKGGDRRSIGRADEVVSDIQKNRSLLQDVKQIIKLKAASGSPAIQARRGKLLKRLSSN
jgi:hypothetical protein